MSGQRHNPNGARYQAQRQQEAIRRARQEHERQNQAREMQLQQHRPNLAAASANVPAPTQTQPSYVHTTAAGVEWQHRAPEPLFVQEPPIIPFGQRILAQRPIPPNDHIGLLNPGARANDPTDRRHWPFLFAPAESRTPSPPAASVLPNQGQPAQLWDGTPPTLHGVRWLIQTTTRDGQVPDSRFPLRISQGSGPREFVAPLRWVTEDDRQLQQTVVDPDLIAPFYQVRDPDQDRFVPRSTESEHMRRGRIELGRYGDVPFHSFPPNPAYPPHTPEGRQLPLQPWMPPYNMPRHPVMAYWGHDLTQRVDDPRVWRLPQMLLWKFHSDPNTRGTFVPRPMFEHTPNNHTDRGWGPGVRVHPSLQPGLALAVGHMQTQILTQEAQTFRAEERALNEAADVVQEPSPVVYSPASEDVPMDDVSVVSKEDNDDERDLDWQEDEEL